MPTPSKPSPGYVVSTPSEHDSTSGAHEEDWDALSRLSLFLNREGANLGRALRAAKKECNRVASPNIADSQSSGPSVPPLQLSAMSGQTDSASNPSKESFVQLESSEHLKTSLPQMPRGSIKDPTKRGGMNSRGSFDRKNSTGSSNQDVEQEGDLLKYFPSGMNSVSVLSPLPVGWAANSLYDNPAARVAYLQALRDPYVKALSAHRQEIQNSIVYLEKEVVDSLASKLSTQRDGGLAMLNQQIDPGVTEHTPTEAAPCGVSQSSMFGAAAICSGKQGLEDVTVTYPSQEDNKSSGGSSTASTTATRGAIHSFGTPREEDVLSARSAAAAVATLAAATLHWRARGGDLESARSDAEGHRTCHDGLPEFLSSILGVEPDEKHTRL